MGSFVVDQQPFGWPYAGLKPSFYSIESATWKGSWLQVPNMAPTYEPFITDFESLLCDRNILKSSTPDLYTSSTSSTFNYGILSMIVFIFIMTIGLLLRNYYFTRNLNVNKYSEEIEDSEIEKEQNSYLHVHNHENDFSSWIDNDSNEVDTTTIINNEPNHGDKFINADNGFIMNKTADNNNTTRPKSDYLSSLILS